MTTAYTSDPKAVEEWLKDFGFIPDKNLSGEYDHYVKLDTHEWISNDTASSLYHYMMEARYMGSADFANWIVRHNESSFRQERAWFKIKPGLLIKYQAELLRNLDRYRTNAGADPNSTVYQSYPRPHPTTKEPKQ